MGIAQRLRVQRHLGDAAREAIDDRVSWRLGPLRRLRPGILAETGEGGEDGEGRAIRLRADLGEEKGIERGRVEGRATEARSLILRLGTKRLGVASPEAEAVLEAADIVHLEAFVERLLEVQSWQELLAP